MDNGFIEDTEKIKKKIKKIEEKELILPIRENDKCQYCENYRLDTAIQKTFNKNICFDCKFDKLNLITKTTVIRNFLLTNEEISKLKFLSKPNPRKGTWHDMQLFDIEQVENCAIEKYGSLENLEKEKTKRKQSLLNQKKKKVRERIKDLRKKTMIENKLKEKKHKHKFVEHKNGRKCECGMILESEEI